MLGAQPAPSTQPSLGMGDLLPASDWSTASVLASDWSPVSHVTGERQAKPGAATSLPCSATAAISDKICKGESRRGDTFLQLIFDFKNHSF